LIFNRFFTRDIPFLVVALKVLFESYISVCFMYLPIQIYFGRSKRYLFTMVIVHSRVLVAWKLKISSSEQNLKNKTFSARKIQVIPGKFILKKWKFKRNFSKSHLQKLLCSSYHYSILLKFMLPSYRIQIHQIHDTF
jgi:hypothetical protein